MRLLRRSLRKAEGTIWIARQIFIDPACGVDTKLVQEARAKCVIPERGHGSVGVSGVEKIHQPVAVPIQTGAGVRHVVDAERNEILASGIETHPAVVLPMRAVRRLYGAEKPDIRNSVQVARGARAVSA